MKGEWASAQGWALGHFRLDVASVLEPRDIWTSLDIQPRAGRRSHGKYLKDCQKITADLLRMARAPNEGIAPE